MDIVFVAVGLVSFAVAVVYVRDCDRIVGRDQAADGSPDPGSAR